MRIVKAFPMDASWLRIMVAPDVRGVRQRGRVIVPSHRRRTAARPQPHHQRDDEDDQEQAEQELCNARGCACDTAKAEQTGDDRDDQEHKAPVQHRRILLSLGATFCARHSCASRTSSASPPCTPPRFTKFDLLGCTPYRRSDCTFQRLERRFELPFRDGTLPPARRASLKPIAMACLRLLTFLPE